MVIGICIILIAEIFFGDMWIKNRIEKKENSSFPIVFCKRKLLLKKYHNTGAMFNFGASEKKLTTAVSVALTAAVFLVFLLSLGQRGNHVLRVGLSLLLGGAFSNTYDRLKRKYVVDYLSFNVKWNWLRRLVFNLSDFCIIIGSLLTVWELSD